MDQLDIGGEILLLAMQSDNTRIGLKTDDLGNLCGQLQSEGTEADADLNHFVVRLEFCQLNNPPGGMGMDKKILAKLFMRCEALLFKQCSGSKRGHLGVS